MPVVFRYKSFRFFFYSNEGKPREPLHVHVLAGGNEANIWREAKARIAAGYGFEAGTLRELVEEAQTNRELIERTWHDYFGRSRAIRRRQPVGRP
jgi:hypothetical protein